MTGVFPYTVLELLDNRYIIACHFVTGNSFEIHVENEMYSIYQIHIF